MTFYLSLNSIYFFVALLILARADFYDDLGISRKATLKEIKKAYRSKSLEFHPDKNKAEGAADKFGEISRAYEVLSDEEKRQIYDERGEEGLKRHEDGGGGFGGGGGFDDIFSHFGFGGRQRQDDGVQRTPSVEIPLRLTLQQMYEGVELEVDYVRQTLCMNWEMCMKTSKECQGPGVKVKMQQIAPGFVQQVQQRDNNCVARGKMWKPNCRDCPKGKTQPEKISLSVEVTPGMRAGERVSFESVADEKPGMEAGDLHFVILQVDVNPVLFTRDGDRLYKTMEIPLVDALVGFKRTLEHLDGHKFTIQVDKVTECDHVMRVPGKGMPRRSGRGFGDLYLTFEIDFPEELSAEQKAGINKILRGDVKDEL
mmetsp:Transcript_31984/g.36957  ORF Transcript_31984/g.36957 Transcript_31984/m.36957 type:complete len:369 (-) Transcript_31984:35-1141(-)